MKTREKMNKRFNFNIRQSTPQIKDGGVFVETGVEYVVIPRTVYEELSSPEKKEEVGRLISCRKCGRMYAEDDLIGGRCLDCANKFFDLRKTEKEEPTQEFTKEELEHILYVIDYYFAHSPVSREHKRITNAIGLPTEIRTILDCKNKIKVLIERLLK